jgi:hypothetical protein
MGIPVPNLVARVTKQKSAQSDRFQCSDVYQLWDNGNVTVDHCVEDEEWGGIEESRENADCEGLPQDFFKEGFSRVIDHWGSVQEDPLTL